MALTFTNASKSTLADTATGLLNSGAGDAAGDIAWYTAANLLLATSALSNPAFGAAVNGVADGNPVTQAVVAGSANPSNLSYAAFRNRANVEQFRGSIGVTGSGANVEGASVAVNDGDTLDITDMTYTQP